MELMHTANFDTWSFFFKVTSMAAVFGQALDTTCRFFGDLRLAGRLR